MRRLGSQFRLFEVGQDLFETVTYRGETFPAEGEEIGGALDILEEGVDIDIVPV